MNQLIIPTEHGTVIADKLKDGKTFIHPQNSKKGVVISDEDFKQFLIQYAKKINKNQGDTFEITHKRPIDAKADSR